MVDHASRLPSAWAMAVVCAVMGLAGCAEAPSQDCTVNGTCSRDDTTDVGDGAVNGERGRDAALDAADGFDGFVCDPNKAPHDEACVIGEAYGVFVASASNGGSDTGGDGSRAKPYATIGKALASLGGKSRVYICDANYAEYVSLNVAASLYGGLACPTGDAGWSYAGGQAQVQGAQNQIPLMGSGVPSAVSVEDLAIAAANASGQDDAGNGQSSIGVFVNASTSRSAGARSRRATGIWADAVQRGPTTRQARQPHQMAMPMTVESAAQVDSLYVPMARARPGAQEAT